MQIILTDNCLTLAGILGSKSWGYYVRCAPHKDGSFTFHSQRSKYGPIAAHGHICFIGLCAELAQKKMYISDIKLDYRELIAALWEAGDYSLAKYYSANPHELTMIEPVDPAPVALPIDPEPVPVSVPVDKRSKTVILNAEQTNNFFTRYNL